MRLPAHCSYFLSSNLHLTAIKKQEFSDSTRRRIVFWCLIQSQLRRRQHCCSTSQKTLKTSEGMIHWYWLIMSVYDSYCILTGKETNNVADCRNNTFGKKRDYMRLNFLWCFTDLPEFHPQCSALLRAHWSILSKNFYTLFELILRHTTELSGCPRWRKCPSDVCTGWNRHCSKKHGWIQIKT